MELVYKTIRIPTIVGEMSIPLRIFTVYKTILIPTCVGARMRAITGRRSIRLF